MGDDNEMTDLERVGLFVDGPYDTDVTLYRVHDFTTIMGRDKVGEDDPLRLGGPFPLIPGHKTKAATNDWTFGSEFLSLWEDVAYEDPGTWKRKDQQEKNEKILDGDFNSTIGFKTMNGKGTLYGTFMENEYEAFSPETKEKIKDEVDSLPNILTNPPKKGTGYGYVNICLNEYPEHLDDPLFDHIEAKREMREAHENALNGRTEWVPPGPPKEYFDSNPYFDTNDPDGEQETYDFTKLEKERNEDSIPFLPSNPTKKINGNKDVVEPLEKFPEYEEEPYVDPPKNVFRQSKLDPDKPIFKPLFGGNRSRQSRSILSQNINRRINATNFHLF